MQIANLQMYIKDICVIYLLSKEDLIFIAQEESMNFNKYLYNNNKYIFFTPLIRRYNRLIHISEEIIDWRTI